MPRLSKAATACTVATAARYIRRANNLDQREVATRMGISQAAYSRLESGKASWTLAHLEAFARAAGVNFSLALGGWIVAAPR